MAQSIDATAQSAPRKNRKDRLLTQIKSLDDKDDEKTTVSKRISWILRHGAKAANVAQDQSTKWVKFTDMCECEILKDYSSDLIWKVIVDFNGKKLRYEISEQDGVTHLRAYVRSEEHKKEQRKHEAPSNAGGNLRGDAPEFAPAAAGASPTAAADASSPNAQAMAQAQQMAAWQQMMMFNPMMMMNPFMMQAAANAASGKYQGWIKSFNTLKGFGFIECQATYAQYGRDVFLHKAQIKDFPIGSFVSFSCEVSKQGLPQAKDLQLITAGTGQAKGKGKGEKGEKGKGKGKGEKGKGKGRGKGEGKKGEKAETADKEKDGEGGEKAEGAAEKPAAAPEAAPADAS